MHRALEMGGSALQFVVDQIDDVFALIPEDRVNAAVSLFSTQGALQDSILERANNVFSRFNGWSLLEIKQLGGSIHDSKTAKSVLNVLLEQPWASEMLEGALKDNKGTPEEVVSALVAVSELDSSTASRLQSLISQTGNESIHSFVHYGLGDKNLSSAQKTKLTQIFLDMAQGTRIQTVNALKGSKGVSNMVKILPTYWSGLSEGDRRILLNLTKMADVINAEALGKLAEDSEGIISQRSLVHEIVGRAELEKLKQQSDQAVGAGSLNAKFQLCVSALNNTIENEISRLKQEGKSAQVPELAQSFLKSEHFKSDALVNGLSLREAVVAVSAVGGAEFDHLPWAEGYGTSPQRKEAIEKELIAQLADCRIGNGDQQTCYEGSIERVVMALRPFLDLAPSLPSTQEFFAVLPRVFNELVCALDQDSASCEQLNFKLQSTQPDQAGFTALDLYQELEPQIQLLMAREFPSLLETERKNEAIKLFEMAGGCADELDLPHLLNLPVRA